MTLSLLQLNINGDNYWAALVQFLKTHDFDIIHLQEVCGKETIVGNLATKIDCFSELKTLLHSTHKGEIAVGQRYESSPTAYLANATFYKKEFTLVDVNVLTLHKNPRPFPKTSTNFESVARNLLHLTLELDKKTISFLNTHLAWAKTTKEQPHQTQQGEILMKYLKTIPSPFVFSGDFNLDPENPLIKKINSLAKNLIDEHAVKNTLNPRTHRARVLFPPGAAVDYIFVTPDITVKNFDVLENEDLSDHLGLITEIEI